MTTSSPILLNYHSDAVAVLTINRPEVRNALNWAAMLGFAAQVADLSQDAALRCLVIVGAGEAAFCSGGDLVEMSAYPTEADAVEFVNVMSDALVMLERLSCPVIAAVNGYALGGGGEVALACDLRIADETARLGLMQIKLALTPSWGSVQRLLRYVGYAHAMEFLLEGRILNAEELLSLRMVNRVVPQGQALPHALELAHEIAAQPPEVVRTIKRLLHAGLRQPYEDALRYEREQFPALWTAEPHLNAVAAFVNNRRKP